MLLLALISNDINQVIHTVEIPSTSVVIKKARKLLFWVIMNIIRGQHHYDNHVVDYYYKLRKQPNEKPHKTAIIACINRLLKTIHYLVMNHKLYDYQMSPH